MSAPSLSLNDPQLDEITRRALTRLHGSGRTRAGAHHLEGTERRRLQIAEADLHHVLRSGLWETVDDESGETLRPTTRIFSAIEFFDDRDGAVSYTMVVDLRA